MGNANYNILQQTSNHALRVTHYALPYLIDPIKEILYNIGENQLNRFNF